MELNEETVKKSLDWLDSLVGNSNDSDIALLTYQLLGILYDTCEKLTEENEAWQKSLITQKENADKVYYELACKVEDLRAENERLSAIPKQMKERLQAYFGTYVLGYKIPLSEALKAVNQIAKEMLEGE